MANQIIIKVVGNYCNLRCDYCFYNNSNQSDKTIMKLSTLSKFMEQFLSDYHRDHLQIIWHGGEPLLATISFFEQAVKLQSQYPQYSFNNVVQTNGTLLNDNWIDFFKKNNFDIGISLDGKKQSHDLHRKKRGRTGTFDIILRNIELCKKRGLPVGIIQTITKDNIQNIEDDFYFIYNMLGQKKWNINFYNNTSTVEHQETLSLNNEDVEFIQKQIINFWLNMDDKEFSIGEIDDLLSGVLNKRARGCSYNGTCGENYFCLNYDGDVYLCDRTSNVSSNSWGNIHMKNIHDILSEAKQLQKTKSIKLLPSDCKVCKWVKVCNNGCSALRDASNKYIFCNARKTSFQYLKDTVNKQKEN